MGRSTSKREQLDLLTTNFSYRMLAGENVVRFFFMKDLLLDDEPARDKGKAFPLGDVQAGVKISEVSIDEKDKVRLKGTLEGKVVFYSVSGPKVVVWEEEDFTREVEVPGALPGMTVNAFGRICYLGEEESPIEAEGKILYQLKIEVEVMLSVTDPRQLNLTVGVKDIPAEKVVRGVITVEELVEEKEISLTIIKKYEFGEELNYIKAMNYYIKDFSWQLEKEGVSFKGELVTSAYFLAGGKSGFQENKQQFNGNVPFTQLNKGLQVSIFPCVEYCAYEINGKNANEQASINIVIRITRTVQQEVVSDIKDYAAKKEYLFLPKLAATAKEPLELVQKLDLPYPKEISAGVYRFLDLEVNVEEDMVEVSGVLEKNIYYFPADDNEWEEEEDAERDLLPLVLKTEDDFHSSIYLPGISPDAETVVYFNMERTEFAPTENSTLQISHASLEVKCREVEEFSVVVPFRVPPGTSMVVYSAKRGDTLLKIARSYGVKTPVIAEANELEEDAVLEAGTKLLIPLMFYTDI